MTPDDEVAAEHWYSASDGTWRDSIGGTPCGDGDSVAVWEDQTANSDEATQPGNQPTLQTNELNGESIIRFDGANDYMQAPFTNGGTMSQPYTGFVVAKMASAVNDGNVYRLMDGSDISNRGILDKEVSATPDAWSIAAPTQLVGDDANANWNIWTFVFNGDNSAFWHNGVSQATGAAGTNTLAGITIGCNSSGSAFFWAGDVAEIILYAANLSTADKNTVGNYLADRYSLSYTDIT